MGPVLNSDTMGKHQKPQPRGPVAGFQTSQPTVALSEAKVTLWNECSSWDSTISVGVAPGYEVREECLRDILKFLLLSVRLGGLKELTRTNRRGVCGCFYSSGFRISYTICAF